MDDTSDVMDAKVQRGRTDDNETELKDRKVILGNGSCVKRQNRVSLLGYAIAGPWASLITNAHST